MDREDILKEKRRYTYLVKEDILLLKRRYTSFLKETHRTFAHSGMGGLLLWLLILTACVGEELQKPLLGEGEGYLRLQVAPVSAEITTSPLTKATVPNAPTEEQLTITITNKSTNEVSTYANSAALPNPLVLKAGVTYTVAASYGTNEALQNTPYFYGSEEVTIQPNQSNDVTVTASLANAMIIPVVTDSLKRHYNDGWTLTASTNNTTTPFPLTFTNGTCTFYAKAGETVSLNFKGTNKAGETADATWKSISNVEACKAYTVKCKPNLTAFYNIQVTATAEHTYDNDYLTGTSITAFSADLNGADLDAIASWQVEVKYGEQTIRTYTGASLDNMTCQNNDWPYIPQGCSLSASVTLKAGDVISNLTGDFTSWQAPDFGITVTDAQTSYSVYKNAGAATANTKDGSSIFDITSSVSISQEILNKYPELLSNVTYSEDLNNATTSAKLGATASLSNLSWARHQLTASVTFDETTKTTSKPYACDVTGLPYKPSNMIEADWDFASWNCKYSNGMIQLGGVSGSGECTATSTMAFFIPSAFDILLNTTLFIHCGNVVQTKFTAKVNGTEIITIPKTAGDNNYTKSAKGSFQPNACTIKLNSSYKEAIPYVQVYSLHILYN